MSNFDLIAEIYPFSNLKIHIYEEIHTPIPLWGMEEKFHDTTVKVS